MWYANRSELSSEFGCKRNLQNSGAPELGAFFVMSATDIANGPSQACADWDTWLCAMCTGSVYI